MQYEFTNEGTTMFYVDIITNVIPLSSIKGAMKSDFRQFLKDHFILTTDQTSYLDEIPNEILSNIGNNLVHALENNYSVSFDINGFAKGFNTTTASPVPTWSNSRLRCRIGNWTEHDNRCNIIQHWGIQCNF